MPSLSPLPLVVALDTVGPLVGFDSVDLDNDLFVPADAGVVQGPANQGGVPIPWAALRLANIASATLGGAPLFTGQAIGKSKNKKSGQLTVDLASRVKTLVDCPSPAGFSAPAGTLAGFAQMLCAPLLVPVVAVGAMPRLEAIGATKTEPVWSVLQRLAHENGNWVWSDPAGVVHIEPLAPYYAAPPVDLLISLPSGPSASANNVIDYTLRDDAGDRYSQYTVIGHGATRCLGAGDIPLLSYPIIATVPDPELTARGVYRPLTIEDGSIRNQAQALTRATREMLLRRVRGLKIEVDVMGWTTTAGVPWQTTQMVLISFPEDGIAGSYMIAGRRLTLDKQNGRRTRLTLIEPGAL
ncbi:hypothetical protein [Zavarzinia sp.]|uniref:hypothetical protein n=1 Tax=Zavarzinia sp. TaxID=2027920 RepID=UPI00356A6B14